MPRRRGVFGKQPWKETMMQNAAIQPIMSPDYDNMLQQALSR